MSPLWIFEAEGNSVKEYILSWEDPEGECKEVFTYLTDGEEALKRLAWLMDNCAPVIRAGQIEALNEIARLKSGETP